MKIFIPFLFLISLFGLQEISAQYVQMERDVFADTIQTDNGPAKKNYTHTYISFGFVLGEMEESNLFKYKYGSSFHFNFGVRRKMQLAKSYALGLEIEYNNQINNFELKDQAFKDIDYWLYLHNFRLGFFNRINFGKRGNIVGKFLDVGAYGEWTFANSLKTREKPDDQKFRVQEQTFKGLEQVEPFNYGLMARIGSNRYVLFGEYRLSENVKEIINIAEEGYLPPNQNLPNIVVGIQIGFH